MRRLVRLLTLTAIAAAVICPIASRPAAALDGGQLVVPTKDGAHVVQNFGPIPASDPSGNWYNDPEGCLSVPVCSVVQITPQFTPGWNPDNDDWYMKMTVSWAAQYIAEIPQNPVTNGNLQSNDLDVYVWRKDTVTQSDGTTKTEYTEVTRSARAGGPEHLTIYGSLPSNPIYYMIVYNSAGVNTDGFTVDTVVHADHILDPDSYLQPAVGFGGSDSGTSSGSGSLGGASDFPAGNGRITPPFVPRSPSELPTANPVSVTTIGGATSIDAFLGDFPNATKALEGDLRATTGPTIFDAAKRRSQGPPKPVHAIAVVIWLVLVPLGLLALVIGYLLRRRPAALTVSALPV